jgi:N-acetylmuramoyl-L-alanine amidase
MIALRQGATALLIVLAIAACAGGHKALSGEANRPSTQPASAACQRSDFRVVVDVGHTVEVPGAISARGVPEYTFNLNLARDVQQALVDAGFTKTVLLITSKAPPQGLFERAFRANKMAANLFIAIHHDSVPDDMLQTWEYDGEPHHFNDSFAGYAIFISNDNADRAGSLMFGKFLGEQLQARGLGYTPHYTLALMRNRRRELLDADAGVYRYDQLVVLKEARMPAVLLEAGSIVDRGEELALASPQRRALESAAIAAAVEEFCAGAASRRGERPVKPSPAPAAAARPRQGNGVRSAR